MKIHLVITLVLLATLALLEGCKREAPNDTTQAPDAKPAESKTESGTKMVLISAGRFTMGDEKEIDATPHEVSVSAFYMDAHLVSQAEYQAVMGENPSRWKGAGNPVEQMRWSDAAKYCNARSKLEGLQPCYDLNRRLFFVMKAFPAKPLTSWRIQ